MHWVEFSVYQFQNLWSILGKKVNEASDKGFFFLEHYFRLKCSNSFIFFFSQAKFKYIYILEIINVDFESISWFIQNEWFIYKSQMKIKISIGMVDRI